MKQTKVIATLAASVALVAAVGCSNGPARGPGSATGAPPPPAATTSAPPSTPTPVAAATGGGSGSATPNPGGSGTPSSGAGNAAELDKAKAGGQDGVTEVASIGKNPVAGDAAATDAGKGLFAQNCASCHGEKGLGDGPAGAQLDPKPRNLTKPAEYKYGEGDLALFRTIKYGVKGGGMAPWDGRMTDDECWQVVNYVKTLAAK